MPRFFAHINDDGTALIEGPDVAHIAGPLRLKPGDELSIRQAQQGYHGRIISISKGKVRLEIIRTEELFERGPQKIHLGMCMLAIKDMDTVIRQATELGVNDIRPLIAERSNIRDINDRRLARWNDIILEAVKQCQRRIIPEIHPPQALSDFIGQAAHIWPQRLVALPEAATTIKTVTASEAGIIIGPEGGFSPTELDLFRKHQFLPVSMGQTVMRAVTAAPAAIGILGAD